MKKNFKPTYLKGNLTAINYKVAKMNDNEVVINTNLDKAKIKMSYNPKTGIVNSMRVCSMTKLDLTDNFSSIKKCIEETKKVLINLVKEFAEANETQYNFVLSHEPVAYSTRNEEPRPYNFKVKTYERRGHYKRTRAGNLVYIDPCTVRVN